MKVISIFAAVLLILANINTASCANERSISSTNGGLKATGRKPEVTRRLGEDDAAEGDDATDDGQDDATDDGNTDDADDGKTDDADDASEGDDETEYTYTTSASTSVTSFDMSSLRSNHEVLSLAILGAALAGVGLIVVTFGRGDGSSGNEDLNEAIYQRAADTEASV
eukprot:CAMPEP_0204619100 /NCGR_PEP_ID=MMETSP0717-20131115/5550_1 /ASSEMBLY_ACC=CAM_ASM_000666 /TAXON_ID=230516 /ORGANISM="Chaetoceros curvisetus" /LENGTH=167 /DNA_ID=CAMNT_0051632997 /DNA_START=413 /DNA_END=916 /DNA_ORIENTATION=+